MTDQTTPPPSSNTQPPPPHSSEEQNDSPESYEDTHVHSVYQAIAPHFSATRHKPWPVVQTYLLSQASGSIGLDIGCGNGKYLSVNPNLYIFPSDRSPALAALAASRSTTASSSLSPPSTSTSTSSSSSVCVADSLHLPYRSSSSDFAICIAVIHHFSTRQRRQLAIQEILTCLRPKTGTALLYVWALEQKDSRRGWNQGDDQDTLVPWVMRAPKGEVNADRTFQRYYHLYREGELEEDVRAVGGKVLESGYDRDNWWVICRG